MSEVKLDSNHIVVPVTGEEDEKQRKLMTAFTEGTIRLQPGGWYFPTGFTKFANDLYNFKYKPTDVILMTYPKSGTTWTQEIVWTMRNNPNLDHQDQQLAVNTRVPFVDMDFFLETQQFREASKFLAKSQNYPESAIDEGLSIYSTRKFQDPRTIKTHLPFSLMPPNLLETCKIIYVVRNPKDVCISYHHHCKLFLSYGYEGSKKEFFDLFLNDELVYGPFFPHILEAWNQRHHKNVLFLSYERMISDTRKQYERISEFLGIKLSDRQMLNIIDYTSFPQMKSRANVFPGKEDNSPFLNKDYYDSKGGFFRKGNMEAPITPSAKE